MSKFFGRLKKSEEVPLVEEEQVPIWEDRIFWVETLEKIAFPVLDNVRKNNLKKNMILESTTAGAEKYAYLEAFARVFNGIAPWLELGPDGSEEGRLRQRYIDITLKAIGIAVNPKSNDYIFYNETKQSLVDIALFAQGLLRSKTQIWLNLSMDVQAKIMDELKNTRIIAPYENHWLLYTSMIEATLLEFTGECDMERLSYAIHKFRDEWYIGDAIYGDGPEFATNYYNSIIIHPMLNDILMVMRKYGLSDGEFMDVQLMRSSRLSAQLERIISPEGTFPIIGKSIAYRCGVFHTLAQAALLNVLPKNINPTQVRSALTKVLRNLFEGNQNFTNGWLLVGLNGHQGDLCERDINTGSLYLCCSVFLPLGLDPNHPFWFGESEEWTSLKAWHGHATQPDQSIDF
ncbi:hypothetical protein SAMN02910315_01310 [Methanobrevibacter millerae]|uniref:DUF2264 domain-containing protein n=2 Tax=Methanobrevibacter millerae TaxID=230361 RepID=A0A1G5WCB7_9EURY|nr:hypothetical protein SAMN02910315_01310 [Methanobrevibacter millerae]